MHRVYMSFFVRGPSPPGSGGEVWVVNFLESDLKTLIGPIRRFGRGDPEAAVRGLAERGNGLTTLAERQAFDAAILHGRGGVFLELTPAQYNALRQTSMNFG